MVLSMRIDWSIVAILVFFFLLSWALPLVYQYILLGAALILMAPFIILERYAFPFLRKYPKLAVVFSILAVFAGGVCWYYAFAWGRL